MADRQSKNGVIYERRADGKWTVVGYEDHATPVGPPDPTMPFKAPKAEADLQGSQADTAGQTISNRVAAGTAASTVATQNAPNGFYWVDPGNPSAGVLPIPKGDAEATKGLRDRMRLGGILDSIRSAREIAMRGKATGFSSLLSAVPTTDAKSLQNAIQPILANLAFEKLDEMRQAAAASGSQGSGLGQVTEREIDLLQGAVRALGDTGVTQQQFLDNLAAVERHFTGAQLAMSGIDPSSDEGVSAAREFGVMLAPEEDLPTERGSLAPPGSTTKRADVPADYQRRHLDYLQQHWGSITPTDYAQFRAQLDREYDFTPDLQAYRAATAGFNQAAQQGQTPASLGAVPGPETTMGTVEAGLNSAAQHPLGAFAANMGNAGAFGLPARLSGNQDTLEALRAQRPVSSFLGEMAGGVTGTMGAGAGLGAGARAAGLALNSRKAAFGADMLYGAGYGATQADDPLYGAVAGGAGAAAGNYLGSRIGRELPGLFKPRSMRALEESVPSNAQLRQQATGLYERAGATGEQALPEQTPDLAGRIRSILQGRNVLSPKGRFTADMPKVRAASDLIDDYAGEAATPAQLEELRKRIGDAVVSQDRSEQSIGAALRDALDGWSRETVEQAAPIYQQARQTSSRYLQDDTIQQALNLAEADVSRLTQSGRENALRGQFRQLERGEIRGREHFTPSVAQAIRDTARGTSMGNLARSIGRFAPASPMAATVGPVAAGAAGGTALGSPGLGTALGAGLATLGVGSRAAATAMTNRNARLASLLARGGPEAEALLETARQEAGRRAGHVMSGIFAPAVNRPVR